MFTGRERAALDGVDLAVEPGEFVMLAGPAGAGKSTLLRVIAGLETLDAGEIRIDGRVVNAIPPKRRGTAMVYHNHVLYPHMTLRRNLAFALQLDRLDAGETDLRVREAAALLGFSDLLDRPPKALSEEQRLRMMVARAVVRRPLVYLVDEPVRLEPRHRGAFRSAVDTVHERLGAAILYATGDEAEAAAFSGRVARLDAGRLAQPIQIMERST